MINHSFLKNTDRNPGGDNHRARRFHPPLLIYCSLIFFAACVCISGTQPALAEEKSEPSPASDRFSTGHIVFSIRSGLPFSPSLTFFGRVPEPGVHFMKMNQEDSHYDFTLSKLGLDFGTFIAPRVLIDLNFQFETLEFKHDSFNIVEIGGGLSHFLPIGKRLFLDLGVGAGTMLLGGNSNDTDYQKLGVHSILGFFLIRNLSIGFGFSYDHYFGDTDFDSLFFRSRLSYFFCFSEKNKLSNQQPRPDSGQ